ncbi:MAG: hypothetical protein J2P27_09190 [Actinobacteria bacterium]|nr:hypothetical protein [Actinomycetota bacterium]
MIATTRVHAAESSEFDGEDGRDQSLDHFAHHASPRLAGNCPARVLMLRAVAQRVQRVKAAA